MNFNKYAVLTTAIIIVSYCTMQGAAERYPHAAAQSEEAQLQEAIRQSRIGYRRQRQLEAERIERLQIQEAMRISAQEEAKRQQQLKQQATAEKKRTVSKHK